MMIDCLGLSELATSALIRNVPLNARPPAHLVGDPLESGETNFLDSFIGGFAIQRVDLDSVGTDVANSVDPQNRPSQDRHW